MDFQSLTSRQSNAFCSVLNLDGHRILLDCGWDEALNYNQLAQLRDIAPTINCVLITHASLYHIGALPYIIDELPENCQIYCTFPIKQLSQIILADVVHCNQWDSNRIVSISSTSSIYNNNIGGGGGGGGDQSNDIYGGGSTFGNGNQGQNGIQNQQQNSLTLTFKNIVISANPAGIISSSSSSSSSLQSDLHQSSSLSEPQFDNEMMINGPTITAQSSSTMVNSFGTITSPSGGGGQNRSGTNNTSSSHSSLASILKSQYPPGILLFNNYYTAHPYNYDTIQRLFDRIIDVSFGEETLLKFPSQTYQHTLKIKCAPAGRTLGGAIWYISNDNDEITYLANISHQRDYHLDPFRGLKQYSSNKLLIFGNKSYDMRAYANFMTRIQWITFFKFNEILFKQLTQNQQNLLTQQILNSNLNSLSSPSITTTTPSTNTTPNSTTTPTPSTTNQTTPTTTPTDPNTLTDPIVSYQTQLQQLYGGIALIQRDIRRQSFLDYVEQTMRTGKGSIFLPVQETVRIIELLCLLNNEWEGQDFTYPIIYIGQYAQELMNHVKSFMVPFSSSDVKKEKNPYSFPHIKTAQTYEQARSMVKRHYSSLPQSSTTVPSSGSGSRGTRPGAGGRGTSGSGVSEETLGSAVYISAVETSLRNGPTADLFRAFIPTKEDTILLTEIPFTAFDPYANLNRRNGVPYPEGCILSFLYHHSTNVGLQYTTPTPLPYTVPGVTDNPHLIQQDSPITVSTTNFTVNNTASTSLLSPVISTINDITATPVSLAPYGSVVGTGAQWEFKPPHHPKICFLETLQIKNLTPEEQKLLQIAWSVGLELEYHTKKQEFILNRRQQAAKQRFLSQNYSLDDHSNDPSMLSSSQDLTLFENDDDNEMNNNNTTFDFLFEDGQNQQQNLQNLASSSGVGNDEKKTSSTQLVSFTNTQSIQTGQSVYHSTRSAKHIPNYALYNSLFGPTGSVIQSQTGQQQQLQQQQLQQQQQQQQNSMNSPTGNGSPSTSSSSSSPSGIRKSSHLDNPDGDDDTTMGNGDNNRNLADDDDNNDRLTGNNTSGNGPFGHHHHHHQNKRFKSVTLELFPALGSDLYVQLEDTYALDGNDNRNDNNKDNNTTGGLPHNKLQEINFLRVGQNTSTSINSSSSSLLSSSSTTLTGNDQSGQYDDLNSVPQINSFNDVFGLSLNLESLLNVVESSDNNVYLSTVLERYKDYKIQHERNTLAHFELEQAELLSTPCPILMKAEPFTQRLDFHCKLVTIPLTTYTDTISLGNYLQQTSPIPQRIITFKGHELCRTLFQHLISREVQIDLVRILLPQPHKPLIVPNETNTRKFVLDETLLRRIKLSRLNEDISIAPIRAKITFVHGSGSGGDDHYRATAAISDATTTTTTTNQLPILTIPDEIALHNRGISSAGQGGSGGSGSGLNSSVFLAKGKNRVTLNTLRDKLSEYGIPAELYRGWLICGAKGKCVVKKDKEKFIINGAMCEDTFRIRDILYDQFEIL